MGSTSPVMGAWFSSTAPRILKKVGSGTYAVGCADLMTGDFDTPDPGLFVRVYYPTTEKATSDSSRPQWPSRWEYAQGLGEFINVSRFAMCFFNSWLVGETKEDCIVGARLADEGPILSKSRRKDSEEAKSKFPVIIFSHGLGGCRNFYSVYCTSMASYGYVVAAIEHRDHSACWSYDLVPQGDGAELKLKEVKMQIVPKDENEFRVRNKQLNQRVYECVKLFYVLEQLDLWGAPPAKILLGEDFDWTQFKGRLEMTKAAIAGHSFGGATALNTTANSTDFQAAIVLDGWMVSMNSIQIDDCLKPTLFLNVGSWQWEENLKVMRKLLSQNENNAVFTLSGTVHQMFSDFPFLLNGMMARRMGVQGAVDARKSMEAAVELSRTFLEEGKDALEMKLVAYSHFVTNEIYGRERYKI